MGLPGLDEVFKFGVVVRKPDGCQQFGCIRKACSNFPYPRSICHPASIAIRVLCLFFWFIRMIDAFFYDTGKQGCGHAPSPDRYPGLVKISDPQGIGLLADVTKKCIDRKSEPVNSGCNQPKRMIIWGRGQRSRITAVVGNKLLKGRKVCSGEELASKGFSFVCGPCATQDRRAAQ